MRRGSQYCFLLHQGNRNCIENGKQHEKSQSQTQNLHENAPFITFCHHE